MNNIEWKDNASINFFRLITNDYISSLRNIYHPCLHLFKGPGRYTALFLYVQTLFINNGPLFNTYLNMAHKIYYLDAGLSRNNYGS